MSLEVIRLRSLYAFIVAAVLLGVAAAGQFGLDLKVDTYVDKESPDANFSSADTLWASSSGDAPVKEAYLGFRNIFGSVGVFNNSSVNSATLSLYATEAERSGDVTAYFLEGIKLGPVTWNDREERIADETANVTFGVAKTGKVLINVTNIVKKAVDTCKEGCDFTIVLVADGNTSIGFASKESVDFEEPSLEFSTAE